MISERQRGDFFKISTQKGIQATRLWLGWLEVIFLLFGVFFKGWIDSSFVD